MKLSCEDSDQKGWTRNPGREGPIREGGLGTRLVFRWGTLLLADFLMVLEEDVLCSDVLLGGGISKEWPGRHKGKRPTMLGAATYYFFTSLAFFTSLCSLVPRPCGTRLCTSLYPNAYNKSLAEAATLGGALGQRVYTERAACQSCVRFKPRWQVTKVGGSSISCFPSLIPVSTRVSCCL